MNKAVKDLKSGETFRIFGARNPQTLKAVRVTVGQPGQGTRVQYAIVGSDAVTERRPAEVTLSSLATVTVL